MNSMTMQTKKGKCIVKNCKNSVTVKIKRGDKENAMKVTYHRFPKDPKRRQKWADALQLKIENVTDNHRVCSIHFFETAFDKRLPCKIRLRENAIPFYFHQIKSEHDNHKNCIKLEANHFSPETQNQYPANQRILKRSPSFILNESDKKRMNTLEIEKLPEVEEEKRRDSRNKICVDRATSVSPERFNSPTMKRIRKRFVEKIIIEKKEKKRIYNKLRLAQAKNASMEKEIAKLREEKLLSEKQLNDLKVMDNVLKRAVAKVKHEKLPRVYNPELRSFALTMHFYSPAAYTYLRHKFHSGLPHPKTISKWYRVVHGEPGICSEALDIIKKRAEEAEYPLLVSFMFDGMHIMKNCDKDGKGLVNFGNSIPLDNNETPTLAREALVFLVNCINQSWKIPVAYFLIDHLSGKEIAGLINQCLVALHDSKVKVVSLTFDGTAANIAAVKSLIISNNTDTPNSDKENETDNSIDDYKWWFKHPVTQEEIYVFLDPCHMLKLIRNTLGSEKMLRDGNGGLIGWKFVTMLHEMQVHEGMHLGNKLRTAHINYVKQKMKVRLAAQVFSKSVAAALKVCRNDLKLCEFFNCGPTIQFIEQVNDLFDIFNLRNIKGYDFHKDSNTVNYKKVLNATNKDHLFSKLDELSIYLKNLKLANGKFLINTAKKTGFIGFLVCIESFKSMYQKLCESGSNSLLKYIPTYKLSQDHLETFFSCIRSRGGHNNNPTGRQFSVAFKKLLLHIELRATETGNCIPIEHISILHVSSRNVSSMNVINASSEIYRLCDTVDRTWTAACTAIEIHSYVPDILISTEFFTRVIAYMAGFVVKHLRSKLYCEVCVDALTGGNTSEVYSLIAFKNMGGLCYPSDDVYMICQKAEKAIRFALKESGQEMLKPKYSEM